ncbi:MAG: dihydrodipicolinate synthase family protein [Firmicutes bacterium]|jgi:4-hydroxy-tetrahydrodipicolinate synthase|nr:dihydrodipicolinate synthase family protein [Bacillota bacterium]
MFQGIYVAITTPFTKDLAVDESRLREHADWLIRQGVHGLVPTGTCGEYQSLSVDERERVIRVIAEVARGRVPILVGVAAPTTELAVGWARLARELDAEGIMALPPIGYRATWHETIAYYRELARPGLPIVIYNNPFDTAVDLTPDRLRVLSEIPEVMAVKEFSGDVRRIPEILDETRLQAIAGADDLALEGLSAGATGWIAGLTNIVPHQSLELYQLATTGQADAAWALYRRLLPLFRYDSTPRLVQVIKYGLEKIGRPVGHCRPPRLPLEEAEREAVDRALTGALA